MTIIAYRSGTIAADDLIFDEEGIVSRGQKIFRRTSDHALVAACGDSARCDLFIEAVLRGITPEDVFPEEGNNAGMIVIPGKHIELWTGPKRGSRLEASFYAIGSGYETARGVMLNGGTAKEAVVAVCRSKGWPAVVNTLDFHGNFTHTDVNDLAPIHIEYAPRKYRDFPL